MRKQLKIIIIIILILLFCLIIFGIYYFINKVKSNFDVDTKFKFGLCDIKEPYMDPRIIKNIITKNEAQELINWARPKLGPAELTSYTKTDLSHRNNTLAWCPKTHPISKKIIKKAMQITNLPEENFEKIQICNYQKGQFFKPHQDQCTTNDEPCIAELKRGGQRLFNILLYLNNNFEGGETYFTKLNKKYKLPIGAGVLWAMTNKKGNQVHPLAEHSGLPITSGEKWIANIWARKSEFVEN